jgi:hypothetical protein
MTIDVISKRRIESGTILRAYAPSGLYWRDNFSAPTAIYVNEHDLIFSACHFDERPHKGEYYSEFDEPMIDELRLMAALVLPIGWNCGVLVVYPLSVSLWLNEKVDLTSLGTADRLSKLLRSNLSFSENFPWIDGPSPPAFNGLPYFYRDEPSPLKLQHRIYESIDVSDHLLMRGLGALIKGAMLTRHRVFGEQAHYSLYVALEASFQLILRKLRDAGVTNPGSVDAASLIEKTFGEAPSGRGYFEDYYSDRIMTMHPQSRFGIFPYAPISNSDFFGLYYSLREVYRWIILGEYISLAS